MNILKIPFNKYLGIQNSNKSGYLLMLPNKDEYHNHIDTIHASVQFALAEASSGEFLIDEFEAIDIEAIPVVRKSEISFCCPAEGELFSKATYLETNREEVEKYLDFHNRMIIKIKVELFNASDEKVMESTFDWFLTKH